MASSHERHRVADPSAVVDVTGRHRLAAAGAHLAAGAVGVTEKILLHRLFCTTAGAAQEFHAILRACQWRRFPTWTFYRRKQAQHKQLLSPENKIAT
jgi:hypothetical protein